MLNLVQIQDKLKDMPTQAIMSYANGQNPMVPPYLALGELNRRKQMEQSATAEQARSQGEPPTVKEATEQQLGLMNLQKGRTMQAQQNMGQAMANAPAPVPAGIGEEPVQMARGGRVMPAAKIDGGEFVLAAQKHGLGDDMSTLNKIVDLVNRGLSVEQAAATVAGQGMAAGGLARLPSNIRKFAGGGIVAFQTGGNPEQEMRDFDQASALYEAEREAKKARDAQQPSGVNAADLLKKLVERASKETTLEDLAMQQKRARELAGVSEDPYAESRKEREGLIALRKKNEEGQGLKELITFLGGVAKAKPQQGLGVTLGAGTDEMTKEQERFKTLQETQRTQEMQWKRADEKEKDAIARGDAKGMLDAQQEKDKLGYNIAKLSTDKDRLSFEKFNAAVNANTTIKSLEKQRQEEDPRPGSERWRYYDNAINQIKRGLAKEAGYEGEVAMIESPPEIPKPKKENKGLFGGKSKKEDEKKPVYDSGIPPGLPKGTTVFGRTPDGKVVYLTPDGKKVTEK